MAVLRGFLGLTLFFLFGESLRIMLALPVSGGVIGMILITVYLMLRGSISDSLAAASQALISVLVLLIMPGLAGVFFLTNEFSGQWLAVAVALIAGTLLSVLSTLLLMRRLMRSANEAQSHE